MSPGLVMKHDETEERGRALGTHLFALGYEPAGSRYDALLRAGLRYCSHALLVMQERFKWSDTATAAVTALQPWRVAETTGREWPCTRSTHEARLLTFQYDEGFVVALRSLSRRLFQWEEPALPEDLCLFRPTGDPWLGSIAHESDAWLNLTDDESPAMAEALRPIPLRRQPP